MRRRLAWVFVALSVMLVIGFLIPLGLSVKSQAELRALAAAQSDARGVATAMAAVAGATGTIPDVAEAEFVLNTYGAENLNILLTENEVIGSIPIDVTSLPLTEAGSIIADVEGGVVALVPVFFAESEKPVVVAAYVSDKELRKGVTTSWIILLILGLIVVIGTVPLADRLASSLVRPVQKLSSAAHKWASGDLTARVSPDGPTEIAESGRAFNLLAERLTDLLAAERERIADLSHRLRTPLAALRLQAESIKETEQKTALISDISNLEGEVTAIIQDLRHNPVEGSKISDLLNVVNQRMGFWELVAAAQDRELKTKYPQQDKPIPVSVSDADVLTALDNLVQNVLTHTPSGTAFEVTVKSSPPTLIISDDGEGLSSPNVFDRGSSSGKSSGLGLDIVRKVAESSGGEVRIGEGKGTTIVVRFGVPED